MYFSKFPTDFPVPPNSKSVVLLSFTIITLFPLTVIFAFKLFHFTFTIFPTLFLFFIQKFTVILITIIHTYPKFLKT